jgi:hypothetical protein
MHFIMPLRKRGGKEIIGMLNLITSFIQLQFESSGQMLMEQFKHTT